jgi:hypothetical protein
MCVASVSQKFLSHKVITLNGIIISDLTDELLQHHSPFDEHLFSMLNEFIERLPQPVCLIAHNGLKFDFPIIQAELYRIGKVGNAVCNLKHILDIWTVFICVDIHC